MILSNDFRIGWEERKRLIFFISYFISGCFTENLQFSQKTPLESGHGFILFKVETGSQPATKVPISSKHRFYPHLFNKL
jgi:hypothetical protein